MTNLLKALELIINQFHSSTESTFQNMHKIAYKATDWHLTAVLTIT
jgi:hypothetical protein